MIKFELISNLKFKMEWREKGGWEMDGGIVKRASVRVETILEIIKGGKYDLGLIALKKNWAISFHRNFRFN